jgi:hypothetical protein
MQKQKQSKNNSDCEYDCDIPIWDEIFHKILTWSSWVWCRCRCKCKCKFVETSDIDFIEWTCCLDDKSRMSQRNSPLVEDKRR